ncbi:MAG: hypothetical protein FIB07_03440 [Candidatus Methanoperedens sp.]|nr:hypothetical protein [Candidatus Methanoperedens sp.]
MIKKPQREPEILSIQLYREGKASFCKVCEIAGLPYEEMKELLVKNSVEIRKGHVSLKAPKAKAKELTELL